MDLVKMLKKYQAEAPARREARLKKLEQDTEELRLKVLYEEEKEKYNRLRQQNNPFTRIGSDSGEGLKLKPIKLGR